MCKKWKKPRRTHLAPLLAWRPADIGDEAYARLLCGSKEDLNDDIVEYPDWLRFETADGLVPDLREVDPRDDGDDDDDVPVENIDDPNDEDGGVPEVVLPGEVEPGISPFLRVVHFLQEVVPIRTRIVKGLLSPRADATLDGMVALAGPDGQAGARQDPSVE